MTDPIANYLAQSREHDAATAELNRLTKPVLDAGHGLHELRRSSFSFSNTSIGLPPSAVLGRGAITVDAKTWPTADAIQNALARWHQAKQNIRNAWGAISLEDQKRMKAPVD